MKGKAPEEASLLDILVDGFEKNEILGGWHWRQLPMHDEAGAQRKHASLVGEATRWKGAPSRTTEVSGRRLAAWSDLEIRQAGRGVMVRALAPGFDAWWHDSETWRGEPMTPIFAWLEEERKG